ncbi:Mandelate racemase [Fulvivirga imtechensis AK7]|uniref:Mandelate racemase n=1 Tax=Fulvivirga imtechensis AK7 TaxID=1237149 RepID=L8K0Y1_9BACT|nr:enolase C-terminal domain-like protein [Fulvivirga imtechensis]ELR73117.1 Mandelate racemase [Fulvivirga imtechensis AK7]
MGFSLATTEIAETIQIGGLTVTTCSVPTDGPESDGTLTWNCTTIVLVEIEAGGQYGLGYTYASEATATYIVKELQKHVVGKNIFHIPAIIAGLKAGIRNQGMSGIAMMAISAIDIALWDLKAKIFGQPLFRLLGARSEGMPLYGSGGFTNYSTEQLQGQLASWEEKGMKAVKMKIGREPKKDPERVKVARTALCSKTDLYVDANGAYNVKEALSMAEKFAGQQVTWFEEPVSSDNLEGLRYLRDRAPASIQIAAGEYGYIPQYFQHMIFPRAIDVLQADATRCGGISGFLDIGTTCATLEIPFSSHCAPLAHLHAALALPEFYIAEYFHDHTRIEKIFFESAATIEKGYMFPDEQSPGLGIELKHKDIEKYKLR